MDIIKHTLSIAKQVCKLLSYIGSLPEKAMFVKYVQKELIELLPGLYILRQILWGDWVATD